jgi:hypothetical protein
MYNKQTTTDALKANIFVGLAVIAVITAGAGIIHVMFGVPA